MQMVIRILLSCVVFAISACSGEMQGRVRGSGESVKFTYEQGLDSDMYTALIGSETFKGRAVMDGATSSFGTGFGTTFVNGQAYSGTTQIYSQTTTGNFVAVLLGDKGSSLQCQMRYADSSGFTTSGGVGLCKHSDGRVIDVVW
jgi:hypothetical protein